MCLLTDINQSICKKNGLDYLKVLWADPFLCAKEDTNFHRNHNHTDSLFCRCNKMVLNLLRLRVTKTGLLFGMFSDNWIFIDHHNMMLELTITSMTLHHALYMTCILREKSTSRKECFLHLLRHISSPYIHCGQSNSLQRQM